MEENILYLMVDVICCKVQPTIPGVHRNSFPDFNRSFGKLKFTVFSIKIAAQIDTFQIMTQKTYKILNYYIQILVNKCGYCKL